MKQAFGPGIQEVKSLPKFFFSWLGWMGWAWYIQFCSKHPHILLLKNLAGLTVDTLAQKKGGEVLLL